jgi:hypothetical protein
LASSASLGLMDGWMDGRTGGELELELHPQSDVSDVSDVWTVVSASLVDCPFDVLGASKVKMDVTRRTPSPPGHYYSTAIQCCNSEWSFLPGLLGV